PLTHRSPPQRIHALLSATRPERPSPDHWCGLEKIRLLRSIAVPVAVSRALAAGDRVKQNMDVLRASQDMDVLTEWKAIPGRQGAASDRGRPSLARPTLVGAPLTAPARARRYKGAGAHGHAAISAGGLHEAVSGIDPGRVRVGGLPARNADPAWRIRHAWRGGASAAGRHRARARRARGCGGNRPALHHRHHLARW